MSAVRIAIIGAGLGGLTAAIALARRGLHVDVYEQTTQLGEVGAGLTVARSAQKVFAELGLFDRIRAIASVTTVMAFLHYRTGDLLAGGFDHGDGHLPDDGEARALHIHRADLHAILVEAFAEIAPGRMHLGKRLVGLHDASGPVRLDFADGTAGEADLVVGADGVRSVVRQKLWGDGAPRFTGQLAYRFMMSTKNAAPWLLEHGRAAVFQGPGRVFNRYTLRGGALLNCVGITRSDAWQADGWSTPATPEEMLDLYQGWHPDVLALLAHAPADNLIKWALFDRPPLPGWLRGRTTLLGDAAHPMLPFLGLGAAMAIEDAMILARALERSPDVAGLAFYEEIRRPRVERIATLSRLQGEFSQSTDPDSYDPKASPAQDKSLGDHDPVHEPLVSPIG